MSERITRKKFFLIGGTAGLAAAIVKLNPFKMFSGSNPSKPEIKINPLAVKRENKGRANG